MASIACTMNLNKRPNSPKSTGHKKKIHESTKALHILSHQLQTPLCQNSALFWWPQKWRRGYTPKNVCLDPTHNRSCNIRHIRQRTQYKYDRITPIWQDPTAGAVSTYRHVSIELGGGRHFCQTECVFGDEIGAWATWGSRWFGVLCLPWLGSRGCIHRSESNTPLTLKP